MVGVLKTMWKTLSFQHSSISFQQVFNNLGLSFQQFMSFQHPIVENFSTLLKTSVKNFKNC